MAGCFAILSILLHGLGFVVKCTLSGKKKERIPYQSNKCLGNPDVYDGLSESESLLVLEMRAL